MNGSALLPWMLVVPLSWATGTVLLAHRRHAYTHAFNTVGSLLLVALAATLYWVTREHGPTTHALGGWSAPLGIGLRADGLAVTLVLLTAIVSGACGWYARTSERTERQGKGTSQRYFWPLFWLLITALNGIWLADDLFNLYVGLELLGLSAVGLVALGDGEASLSAALRYLMAALLGSLAYLLGVALVYASYGTLALPELAGLLSREPITQLALALMTVGLCLKTALFPLHGWLPPAHGVALTPVSAMLSALVVKGSFYILFRLWSDVAESVVTPLAAQALGALGAGAVLWGGWQALRESSLKMLVAHSTVAQLGYLFLFFPLAVGTGASAAALATQGMLLHLVAHALAKSAMFLASGTLIASVGRGGVSDLAGVGRHMPMSLFAFGLAGVSLMGLPPSGGFNAKWLLLQSALAGGQWLWLIVLLSGGLLTAGYVFRVFRESFRDPDPGGGRFTTTPRAYDWVALALATLSIALGFASRSPLAFMTNGLAVMVRGQ